MRAFAPGKLILSGEHSVVYGKPALSMAVSCFSETKVHAHPTPAISINLIDFNQESVATLNELHTLKKELTKRYDSFLRRECPIQKVFHNPMELVKFAVSSLLEKRDVKQVEGVSISIQSEIPIGSGMGSSAATVLSLISGLANFWNLNLSEQEYLELGCETEKLQHGFTSGSDIYVSFHGKCFFFQEEQALPRSLPSLPFYVINTGRPQSRTGECVAYVQEHFHDERAMWNDFESITKEMDEAITGMRVSNLYDLIRANHNLLISLGVVPEKVQRFVHDLEQTGAVAKICGAGAIRGENAGVALVMSESREEVVRLCKQYDFSIMDIQGEERGLHVL